MLTVAKVESGRASYYLSTTAAGADHAGGLLEPDGVWLGRQAAALGLSGPASPGAVRLLFAGRSPVDGERLLAEPKRRRLSAYDCTFSTPKSVSVLFALGPPEVTEQVRLAHGGAVRASLDYLERHGARVREGQVDGRARLAGADGGVIAVGWLHRSSRAPDPHLHTHVLIANLARRRSGEWRPLDARDIYLELRTAGALYETHLRGDLTARLGLAWSELHGVWADVAGSDRRVLRAMSQRSVEIAAAMSESGLRGTAAARLLGEITRPPKDVTTTYPQLVESWWRRAHGEGLAAAHLAAMVGRSTGQPAEGREWEESTLAAASSRSVDGTFSRRDLIQARCAAAPAGRAADAVERDVDHLLAGPRLLVRGGAGQRPGAGWKSGRWAGRPEPRYTTGEMVAAEGRLVAAIAERPFEVTVITYRPGERARALDELSRNAGAWSAKQLQVAAMAPGWRAAASHEAATGIESVSIPALPPSGLTDPAAGGHRQAAHAGAVPGFTALPAGAVPGFTAPHSSEVLVIADAQCLSTAMLQQVLQLSRERSAQLVIFGPAADFAGRGVLAAVARSAKGRLPERLEAAREAERRSTALRRRFGDVDAVVTTSLRAAMTEAVSELRAAPPGGVLVVAGDHGVVGSLREEVAAPARQPFVLHAQDLAGALASGRVGPRRGDSDQPRLVVIGGAAVLQAVPGRRLLPERRHVIVMPSMLSRSPPPGPLDLDDIVGRAAEACRPRYLTAELGAPRRQAAERAEWRSAAAMIEAFREHWGVSDPRNAFGLRRHFAARLPEWELDRRRAIEDIQQRDLFPALLQSRGRGPEIGR